MAARHPLVDPDWVATRLDDPRVRVVEVDVSALAYNEAHIPGAVLWNAYSDLRHADYSPIDAAEFSRLLARCGAVGTRLLVLWAGIQTQWPSQSISVSS